MEVLLVLLISTLLSGALIYADTALTNILSITLYAEEHMGTLIRSEGFWHLRTVFFGFGVSLIILKFLKKGFETYILWTEGDADGDPLLMLTNFVKALAISISFPTLYGWLAIIVEDLTDKVVGAINADVRTGMTDVVGNIASSGLFIAVIALVWFIFFLILYVKFLKQGLELLILRIGVPLAAAGMMDADGGMWKPYTQKFFQSAATIIVQIALAKMGVALMVSGHGLWGIAALSTALSTPRFLQEFMVTASGGGNTMGNMYQSVRLVQIASRGFR